MKFVCVCMFDTVAGLHSTPQFTNSVGSAVRQFGDLCKGVHDQNDISRHPRDFALWLLGSWDDVTGRFEELQKPELVSRGSDHVEAA